MTQQKNVFVSLFKKKNIFSDAQNKEVTQAIQDAEKMTSGEIRVYVELKCKYVDPMERAKELFFLLKMDRTQARNGVLVYVALNDKQFAILGDEGIHRKVGDGYWQQQAAQMRKAFREGAYVTGITTAVRSIGASLKAFFPYESDDRNELSDDIIFG